MDGGVRVSRGGPILHVLVDRAHERNRLRPETLVELADALLEAEADDSVSGVVLRAAGETFLSGGVFTDEGSDKISPRYKPAIGTFYDRWRRRNFPVLSVVQGPAVAFGCAIALTSDLTIALPEATFTLPELENGLVPVYAIALMATRHGMSTIRNMVLTRRSLSPAQAKAMGGVSACVTDPASAERVTEEYIAPWQRYGRAVTGQAMNAFAAFEGADARAARVAADDGLEALFRRFEAKQSNQDYLDKH
jgi:enoyl-CoA hydratase/carnithine racemase